MWPNGLRMYIRPVVDDEFSDFGYYRGNVYTKNLLDNGTVQVLGVDDIQYDTLSNGRLVANGLPGQLVKVAVDSAETYLRTNFDKSNNINYRDGDRALQGHLMISMRGV